MASRYLRRPPGHDWKALLVHTGNFRLGPEGFLKCCFMIQSEECFGNPWLYKGDTEVEPGL